MSYEKTTNIMVMPAHVITFQSRMSLFMVQTLVGFIWFRLLLDEYSALAYEAIGGAILISLLYSFLLQNGAMKTVRLVHMGFWLLLPVASGLPELPCLHIFLLTLLYHAFAHSYSRYSIKHGVAQTVVEEAAQNDAALRDYLEKVEEDPSLSIAETLRNRAEDGDADALFGLGRHYILGVNGVRYLDKGINCLVKASGKGHIESYKLLLDMVSRSTYQPPREG